MSFIIKAMVLIYLFYFQVKLKFSCRMPYLVKIYLVYGEINFFLGENEVSLPSNILNLAHFRLSE